MSNGTLFRSTEPNAPALTGATGTLVALLDAVLVNGYNLPTVSSITRVGTTATITFATGHGLVTPSGSAPGQPLKITVSGATQTDYNGTFDGVAASSTTITYTVANSPVTPATGSITAARPGLGWTKDFSATSKGTYRPPSGNRFYLDVDDSGPGLGTFQEARIRGYESMSAVGTGTGPFPTVAQAANGLFVRKSAAVSSTVRAWAAQADDRTVRVFIATGDSAGIYYGFEFGDVYSTLAGDGYRTVIVGRTTENTSSGAGEAMGLMSTTPGSTLPGIYMARSYLGTGGSVAMGRMGDSGRSNASAGFLGSIPYPNAPDQSIWLSKINLHDASGNVRGRHRGFFHWLHPISGVSDGDQFVGAGDYVGRSFYIVKSTAASVTGIYVLEYSSSWETSS